MVSKIKVASENRPLPAWPKRTNESGSGPLLVARILAFRSGNKQDGTSSSTGKHVLIVLASMASGLSCTAVQ